VSPGRGITPLLHRQKFPTANNFINEFFSAVDNGRIVCLGEKGREGLCFWRGEHLLSDLVCRWQHRSAPISCAGCISCQACRDHAHFSLSKAGTHTQICSNQLFRLLARQLENTMPSVLLSNVATNEMAREYYFFRLMQAANLVLCMPCRALLVSASFSVLVR
jgi:hypothetical protein